MTGVLGVTQTTASNYYRIDGADSETGHETYIVLRARSKPHAERLAAKQGILVSTVRIAKPGDWDQAPRSATTAPAVELADLPETEPSMKPLTATAPLEPLPSPSARAAGDREVEPSSVLLACIGAAMIVGGVLALALALWPDDLVRNELQQIDFRLHELSQAVLGSMLVLGGLVVFLVAAVFHSRSR
jgi:hypothetical protein